ncbi:hypothetical protein GQ55_3G202200 [Panicum hallii var. hallii]|uniref:Transcription repressor n=1 Tax=Panicum hallii var. hallii TaxID=1504633 RepID=A0A2T7EBG8_9POAL|nr:hypothetical protein GQ55_3G202200 [Panicum hallii var. hallii]
MRWGIRKQHAASAAQGVQGDEGERGSKQGKGRASSFSPLSWLAKVTGKEKPFASASSACKNGAAAAGAPPFPSCLPKRTSQSPAMAAPGRRYSPPPRRSPPDVVPRRLSVGNDNADDAAARQQCQHLRRHCSLGGDRELPPLGRLIPFSLAGSPARAASAAAPSDATDAAGAAGAPARARRRRRRRSSSRRLSVSGGRRSSSSSISGRMLPPRVRVRSPRRAPGLADSLAVVRRTRDPQRAFRESMVEMIASTRGGAGELERLLACYLSLNADEHHDCIVKVFRQVWFEYLSLLPRPDGRRRC